MADDIGGKDWTRNVDRAQLESKEAGVRSEDEVEESLSESSPALAIERGADLGNLHLGNRWIAETGAVQLREEAAVEETAPENDEDEIAQSPNETDAGEASIPPASDAQASEVPVPVDAQVSTPRDGNPAPDIGLNLPIPNAVPLSTRQFDESAQRGLEPTDQRVVERPIDPLDAPAPAVETGQPPPGGETDLPLEPTDIPTPPEDDDIAIDDNDSDTEEGTGTTVTVTPTNDSPTAVADTADTTEDSSVTIDVLANDTDPDGDALTITDATISSGLGGVSIVGNELVYDPGTDYQDLAVGETAQVEIAYTITDPHGATSSAVATVTVTGGNDGPTAVADTADTTEDASVTIDVLANDSDPDGDALTITDATISSGLGGVSIVGNELVYDPGTDYQNLAVGETAQVEISYTITDPHGATSNAVATITVTGGNDGPTAVADTADTTEDASVTIDALANDTDPDGDALTITDATISSGLGGVSIVGNELVYDPGSDYQNLAVGETAQVEIAYTITDPHGATSSAVAMVTVTGGNDGPTAVADTAGTTEDSSVTIDVLANDTDPDGDALTITDATISSGLGGVSIVGNELVYDPGTDYQNLAVGETAQVEIAYTITDPHGATSSAVATVTVTGGNDGPTAVADTADTSEDSSVTIDVLANDTDPDGDALTITDATISSGLGGVSIVGNELVYDPGTDYQNLAVGETAQVEIAYTITDPHGATSSAVATVTVTGGNDGPTAVADTADTTEDSSVTIDVLANDSDPDGDALTITDATISSGLGGVSIVGNELVYDPGTDYQNLAVGETAQVEIAYTITDPHGATSNAVATITVTGGNDGPTAVADTADTTEDSSVTIDVLANDSDPDGDALTITDATISSGLGDVSIVGNELVYNPGTDYQNLAVGETAQVEIAYTITDPHGATSNAVATITVTGGNDGPTAVADTADTTEDASVTIDVLANDSDPDGDALTITDATISSGLGGVSIVGNELVYDPEDAYQDLVVGETAQVDIEYTVTDPEGAESQAVATVTVTGTNDGPVATDDTATTTEDNSVTIDVLANDTDIDGDALSISDATISSGGGSVSIVGDELVYDPEDAYQTLNDGETAVVEIDYTVSDGQGGTSVATVTLTITGADDNAIFGTPGNDRIITTPQPDHIIALEGDDTIKSKGGSDTIQAGAGDDDVQAGAGHDSVEGGDGDDILKGQGGQDTIDGGDGHDEIQGGGGRDELDGGAGNDTLYGDGGDDTIDGGAGDDYAEGGQGDDVYLFAELGGSDTFKGGDWTDTVKLEGDVGDMNVDWTLTLDQGTIVQTGSDFAVLSDDSAGSIQLNDGSELSFEGVERVEW